MKTPTNSKKETLYLLLDAHAIIHRAYHALPDFTTRSGVPTGALYGVMTMLIRAIQEFKPDHIIACYDLPGPTFRHVAYDAYKGTRKKTDDVLIDQLQRSREIFEAFSIPIYDAPGFEADDVIGTLVTELKKNSKNKIVIASGDMDTMQLIHKDQVLVYTLKKGLTDTVLYNEKSVLDRYGFYPLSISDYKGLRGDTSDNIIGIPGIGEKTATLLLSLYTDLETLYKKLDADEKKFQKDTKLSDRIILLLKEHKDDAFFSKELATIRKDAPLSFTHQDVHQNSFDLQKMRALCEKYEFKSLIPKLESLYTENPIVNKKKQETPSLSQEKNIPDERKVPPLFSLALSLLDSENTHPSFEDYLAYSTHHHEEEAQKSIIQKLHDTGMYVLWNELEVPLFYVVQEMSAYGIGIDTDYLSKLSVKYHKELTACEKKIWELSGQTFNINSSKQLGEVLFTTLNLHNKEGAKTKIKKTTTGVLSTKESELEKLRGTHDVIEYLFEYRELQKLLSTYIDVLPNQIGKDKRIHSTFNQLGAATGRFSSNEPNLQNIPVKTEKGKVIRNAFVAKKGTLFISADYSQIELRIAALLSEDPLLLDVFERGDDIHTSVAMRVFHVPENAVTSEMRRRAKIINFGILYGMGATALSQNLEVTRAEAQAFLTEYKAQFPILNSYLEKVLLDVKKNKYTTTLFGRRRNLQKISSPLPFIKAMYERMAINAPIQGTAADCIKQAMLDIHKRLIAENLNKNAHLVLQIHDEIIYEVDTDSVPHVQKIIIESMGKVLDRYKSEKRRIPPLLVHLSVGKNFGDLK